MDQGLRSLPFPDHSGWGARITPHIPVLRPSGASVATLRCSRSLPASASNLPGSHPGNQFKNARWTFLNWLGRQDSNLGMPESKSGALPLGYAPEICAPIFYLSRRQDCSALSRCAILLRSKAGARLLPRPLAGTKVHWTFVCFRLALPGPPIIFSRVAQAACAGLVGRIVRGLEPAVRFHRSAVPLRSKGRGRPLGAMQSCIA